MKSEDAFVVAAVVAVMLVGSLASLLEIHRLRTEVGQLKSTPQGAKHDIPSAD
jgi:hypothetical protein